MNKFRLHILGCGSASPTMRHLPSCQILEMRGKMIMIDCGEGAQREVRRYKLSFAKINHIFISHLHGDHCFGLPGLISTMALNGRLATLNIYGPIGIKKYVDSIMELFGQQIDYPIYVQEFEDISGQIICDDNSFTVTSVKLKHRIECIGYVFREKKQELHLRKDMLDFYKVPISMYKNILAGDDFIDEDGKIIANSRLTKKAEPAKSYAYISDSSYLPNIIPYIEGVDCLYHEATFLKSEQVRAYQTGHSSSIDAANIARDAKVSMLLLGHYSARYNNIKEFEEEAKTIFENSKAVDEGDIIEF